MKRLIAFAPFALGPAMLLSTPVSAQEAAPAAASDSVNMVIIYGEDACPASSGDEIVVCQRLDESERYRIPPILRQGSGPEYEAWAARVKSYETVGSFGTMSCSPSGAGGELGCTQKLIDAAYAEKEGASDVRFSQLIEEERQKRLATIDEDAAAEQARVEEIEREYMERLERERQAQLPGDGEALPQVTEPAPPPPEGE